MARCTQTNGLEVYHRSRYGGNGLDNAEVLCQPCHEATPSYGMPGLSPSDFSDEISEETKKAALRRAGNRCECTRRLSLKEKINHLMRQQS